jgi:DNA-binding CsgD family transcriptional regulator
MASTDLTPTRPHREADRTQGLDPGREGRLIRRPAELVELAELVYRGVFGAGLGVATLATLYAASLTALQPAGQRAAAGAICCVLLLAQLAAVRHRDRLYPLLRRRPWLVFVSALVIAASAWGAGPHNQQLFYVATILLGTLGATVSLRVITLASLLAAAGLAAPHIADGSWAIGEAVAAALLPPLLWLVLEQLARFMLRLHETQAPPRPTGLPRVRVRVEHPPSTSARPATASGRLRLTAALAQPSGDSRQDHPHLSARQLEVLLLCAEGLNHEQIAACLQIGAVQVGRHLRKACNRAQVARNPELIAWAIRRGLIPSEARDPRVRGVDAEPVGIPTGAPAYPQK